MFVMHVCVLSNPAICGEGRYISIYEQKNYYIDMCMISSIHKLLLPVYLWMLFNPLSAWAQSIEEGAIEKPDLLEFIQKKHGYDQELINGIQYYYPYSRALNHPYYGKKEAHQGAVILSGKRYDDVWIHYDIYSHHLVLEYYDRSGGVRKIILSPSLTDAFELDGNYFEKLTLDEKGPLFYQVISMNGLACYIHWEKELLETSYDFQHPDYFTDPARTYYLDYAGNHYPFSNRRTFASLFQDDEKRRIKKYLRQNSIRFQDIPLQKLINLLEFISSNEQSTSGN